MLKGIMRRNSRVVINSNAADSYRFAPLEGQTGIVTRMPLIGNKVTIELAVSFVEVRIPRDYLTLWEEREPVWA